MRSFKRILSLFLCLLVMSCAAVPKEGTVIPKYQGIYQASVSIADESGDVFGSGTIIYGGAGKYTTVITAAHVIKSMLERGKQIKISTAFDKLDRSFEILKIDHKLDLALIISTTKEKKNIPFVKIAGYGPNIGDDIVVIGAPAGAERTLTTGIISNFRTYKGKSLYRTTAPIFFGNSGGGMFNKNGELIGVCHALLSVNVSIFSSNIVPGGFYFVGLQSIRKFM